MQELSRGTLHKMHIALGDPVAEYQLNLGNQTIAMNELIGKQLKLTHLGEIHCIHCQRKTKKSFAQGYCWPCFKALPQCDTCIMSPEKCHFDQGTCRDETWASEFCMTEHIVYLANSTGVKVGITRANQVPTRWLDQGAAQALPIFRVATRQQSGLVEDILRSQVTDRTNWRALLRAEAEPLDLPQIRDQITQTCQPALTELQQRFGLQAIQPINSATVLEISYPVEQYLSKISSFNLDKQPAAEGTLLGLKGQYLIFDTGVINLRKYTAYQTALSVQASVSV